MSAAKVKNRGSILFLVVFVLFWTGIIISAHRHLTRQRADFKAQVDHELSTVAELKAGQLAVWTEERLGDAEIIRSAAALMPELRRMLETGGDPEVERRVRAWIESWLYSQDYANAILLDTKGRVRLAIGRLAGAPGHYAEAAARILRGGRVVFQDFHREPGLPGVHLGLDIPLHADNGEPIGVLLLGIDPHESLYPLLKAWPAASESAEILLVRREQNDVVYLSELRHKKDAALNLRFPLTRPDLPAARAARGLQGAHDGVDYRGVPVLAATLPVRGTPWYLVAQVDAAEVYDSLRKNSVLLMLMAGTLIVLTGAATGLIIRSQRARFYRQKYEAERERRALIGHYDYLSRYANDIILLTDENDRIVEANDRAVACYGYSRGELIGMNFRELQHPSALAEFDAQWAAVARRDGHLFETLHRRKDGSAFPVEVSVRLIPVDGAGFRQSIIRDIAERRAMQESLRQANAKLSAIIESAPLGIMVIDREGCIRLWNKSAERIYGWTGEEVLNRPMPPGVWVSEQEDGRELWDELAAGRTVTLEETTRRRKDGAAIEVNMTSAPLFDAQGSTLGAIAIVADVTDSKRAQEALRESEWRVELAVQASNMGLWDWDFKTQTVYYSPEWKAQLGYSDEEISNDFAEWEVRLHPEDRDRAIAALQRYLDDPSSSPYEAEFRMRHKDGSYRWILARGALIYDAAGNPWRLAGSHLDFTDRREMEEVIRQHRRLVQRILDATPDLLYIYHLRESRFVFANRHVAGYLGYDAERVSAMGPEQMRRIIHPDDVAAFESHYRRCCEAADGEVLEVEGRILHAGGAWRWLRGRHVVFARDENGAVTQILGLAQDITERRRAEEALRKSEARLERAQKIALLGNWATGAPAYEWSAEVYSIFGVSKETFTPTRESFLSLVHPDDRDRVRAAFDASMAAGKAFNIEHRIVRPDGALRYVRQHAEPELDESGRVRMIGIVQDITEYKRLQDQFLQAQRLESVGRLAGGVAHDFNNLLTVIIGYSDLVLAQLAHGAPLAAPMEEIRKAARRAAELTGQLLAFSRKQPVQPKTLDLNALIADLENMLRRLIGEDVKLVTHLGPSLDPVTADPGQMTQVLMNLAVNARDAMPNGGKLILETKNVVFDESYAEKHAYLKPGPYVQLSVSDTGLGMSEEIRNHLFEPFFTTKEKGKGTGLGLSTVYGIIKQAGGHIWVYSEPGVGTTFNICLPRAAPGRTAAEPPKVNEALRGSETVLVVEDQQEVRKLAKDILQRYGYQVLDASCGEEAVELCRAHGGPIHLLLTDITMPVMTGRELAEKIKPLRPQIKVLFMSGYADNLITHQNVLDGNTAYLQKPFSARSLAKKVRETLQAAAP
ncbi:MAG: PAS domain S-box protein [Rhodospirillales bacterium]